MKILVTLLILLLLLNGCMSFAISGQIADVGTTYYGLEHGYEEANPAYNDINDVVIGKIILLGLCIYIAENSPTSIKNKIYAYIGLLGFGYSAWNIYLRR